MVNLGTPPADEESTAPVNNSTRQQPPSEEQDLMRALDLSSVFHETTGEVPPGLLGASMTTVGNQVYVIGGKIIKNRLFSNNVYILDLTTFVWELAFPSKSPAAGAEGTTEVVRPYSRHFHSANLYRNESIIIFGGMGPTNEDGTGQKLLNDVAVFNLAKREWTIPELSDENLPLGRYAHVSAISVDRLVICGGQDLATGNYFEDMHVYDIASETWIYSKSFDRHFGCYRSIAASDPEAPPTYPVDDSTAEQRLVESAEALYAQIPNRGSEPSSPTFSRFRSSSLESQSQPSEDRRTSIKPATTASMEPTASNSNPPRPLNVIHEGAEGQVRGPPIYMYSNYHFADLQRELLLIGPPMSENFTDEDVSSLINSPLLPPGLRFPQGDVIGDWLIISGTYLTSGSHQFDIWALHLPSYQFSKIERGSMLVLGSWNRATLWAAKNSYVVFGHRNRSLVDDYRRRQTNYDHAVVIDLETFGIYRRSTVTSSAYANDVVLRLLSNKEFSELEIITKDGITINASSRILSARWPMFAELQTSVPPQSMKFDRNNSISSVMALVDRPKKLYLPLILPVAEAFLQFIYTDRLPSNLDISALSALLLISARYGPSLERLADLAADGLHRSLNDENAQRIYEVASLAGRTGLQFRTFRKILNLRKNSKLGTQKSKQELRTRQGVVNLASIAAEQSRPATEGQLGRGGLASTETEVAGSPPNANASGKTIGVANDGIIKESEENAPTSGQTMSTSS